MITVETQHVQERLVELIQLQVLYNRLYAVQQKKGDLPQQIEDLELQLAARARALAELQKQIKELDQEIRTLRASNDSLKDHEQKLNKILQQVRNEQEYYKVESDIKEIRLTLEKNMKDISKNQQRVDGLEQKRREEEAKQEELRKFIAEKQELLDRISQETAAQEKALLQRIAKLSKKIETEDARLFQLFERRRRSLREGRALVPVITLEGREERVACSGCHTLLPRQLQWELSQRSQIFVCESCGRFLVDAALFDQVAADLE
ncbi:MAG: hypothetical protein KatS3mg026_1869 [Bacteroidia bacterium]|nr:MAG: hypothetical protein KatS3mg026_1869 [Bacteroidia bacterium]